jgi:D-tyrosyl-tRNA(Tyr) deacylase
LKALLQRVSTASVSVGGEVMGKIDRGLVVFLGVGRGDEDRDAHYLANKIALLRIFSDEAGKFNLSALDVGGEILAVSQFTLLANTKKGHRPSFINAAPPQEAEPLFEKFVAYLKETGLRVEKGIFGERMLVEVLNDGPVTILIESKGKAATTCNNSETVIQ